MYKFYKIIKRIRNNPNFPIYFIVQTGIILPHIQENLLKSVRAPSSDQILWPNWRTCKVVLLQKKILAHICDIYFLLVKKAESVFILRENKPKPNKLVIIVIIRKFTWILQSSV